MSGRHLAFPFRIGSDGRPATPVSVSEHIKGEVIQLLLTNQGERPFLPDFGGGLRRFLFEGNDESTRGIAKAGVTRALSLWLKERITLMEIEVVSEGAILEFGIRYKIIESGEEQRLKFVHEL